METAIDEIKKLLNSDKLIIGAQGTLKALRRGKLAKVYVAKNTASAVRDDLERFAKLAGTPIVELAVPNDELGTMCKKPFPISVIGISP